MHMAFAPFSPFLCWESGIFNFAFVGLERLSSYLHRVSRRARAAASGRRGPIVLHSLFKLIHVARRPLSFANV